MRHEEAHHATAVRDAESLHGLRQLRRLILVRLQALERRNHLLAPGERGTASIRAKLAVAGEPHDDHARQHAEHELGDDRRYVEGGPYPPLDLEYRPVDDEADDARQEYDEGVEHALHKG